MTDDGLRSPKHVSSKTIGQLKSWLLIFRAENVDVI